MGIELKTEDLEMVMSKEQREEFQEPLRKALARRAVLIRQYKRIEDEKRANEREVEALSLLAGTLDTTRAKDFVIGKQTDIEKEMANRWTHPEIRDPSYLGVHFYTHMVEQRPITEEEFEAHAEEAIDLIEYWGSTPYTGGGRMRDTLFRLLVDYDGDVTAMLEAEAPALGFVKKEV